MTRRRLFAAAIAVLVALPWICGGEHQRLGAEERQRLPGNFARLRDGVTCYELQGRVPAEAVVFVHGLSSPSYVWGELPALLREAGYLTLVYDLYGRGWSDRPWVRYDLDLFDHQLEALQRVTGLRGKVHLVGLSMGGIVASEYVLRHPKKVASLTLIDPAGFDVELPRGSALLAAPVVGDWLMQVFGNRLLAGGNERLVHDKSLVPGLVGKFRPQLEYAGYKRAMLSTLRHMPLTDFTARYAELGAAGVPIEVFWGRQDEVAPVSGAALAARLLPHARVEVLEEAGHLPHYEKPAAVAGRMRAFLTGARASVQQALRERKR